MITAVARMTSYRPKHKGISTSTDAAERWKGVV